MPEARGLYQVSREKMRTRHLAYRTEQAYLYWIRRYVNFHNRKHPREMGSSNVEAFLTHLAVDEHVSASTQNQALQALLFLYRQVLEIELPWLENVTRARRPKRLPVVLTVAEVRLVLAQLDGAAWLFANLLYGSGLRLMEALRLRIKDLVIERGELIVRDAKGGKDRVTVLPPLWIRCVRISRSCTFASSSSAGLASRVHRCRSRWRANTLTHRGSGGGSTYFPRTLCARTCIQANLFVTICTRKPCSVPCNWRSKRRASLSRRVAIPFGTASQLTCSRPAAISERCKNCWATPMCVRR